LNAIGLATRRDIAAPHWRAGASNLGARHSNQPSGKSGEARRKWNVETGKSNQAARKSIGSMRKANEITRNSLGVRFHSNGARAKARGADSKLLVDNSTALEIKRECCS
jgi:hypothetical protein